MESKLKTDNISSQSYRLPDASLFREAEMYDEKAAEEISKVGGSIIKFFEDWKIDVQPIGVDVGPRIARYVFQPGKNTKVKKILDSIDDLSLYISTDRIRAVAPLEGTNNVGIEVDLKNYRILRYREIMESPEFTASKSKVAVCLGVDVTGKPIVADLQKMHNLIVAGCTGCGKSVFIENIIANILSRATHDEVKLALIDPKMVEFGKFSNLPHLYAPIAHNVNETMEILDNLTREVEKRLLILDESERSLDEYNAKETEKLPHIVVIIDEILDFMLSGKGAKFKKALVALAKTANRYGIHIIISTQRPTIDVLTKPIRDEFYSRACLRVVEYNQSRLVLETSGAETLLMGGDMLFRGTNVMTPKRIQVPFIGFDEMDRLIKHVEGEAKKYSSEEEDLPVDSDLKDTASGETDLSIDIIDSFLKSASLIIKARKISAQDLADERGIDFETAKKHLDLMAKHNIAIEKDSKGCYAIDLTKDGWASKMADIEDENYINDYAEAMAKKFYSLTRDSLPELITAIEIAVERGVISTSLIQRHLAIGYGKAARFIDCMEELELISEKNGERPRKTLISEKEWDKISKIVKEKFNLDRDDIEEISSPYDLLKFDSSRDSSVPRIEVLLEPEKKIEKEPRTVQSIATAILDNAQVLENDGFDQFIAAIGVAMDNGSVGTALVQRKLGIGFGKAARFIDLMEEIGIVSEKEGAKPRRVLITEEMWKEVLKLLGR